QEIVCLAAARNQLDWCDLIPLRDRVKNLLIVVRPGRDCAGINCVRYPRQGPVVGEIAGHEPHCLLLSQSSIVRYQWNKKPEIRHPCQAGENSRLSESTTCVRRKREEPSSPVSVARSPAFLPSLECRIILRICMGCPLNERPFFMACALLRLNSM